jgi:hypothetical protein
MIALADMWRPLRAVAARVLWTYYRAVKGRDGAPVPAQPLPNLSPKSARTEPSRSKQNNSKQKRSKQGRNGR